MPQRQTEALPTGAVAILLSHVGVTISQALAALAGWGAITSIGMDAIRWCLTDTPTCGGVGSP
jgi:hypothetical protein